MAEFKIDSLQEFYTLEIDTENNQVILRDNKNVVVNTQPLVNAQYGGLYAAFNENTVVTLDGIQNFSRGSIQSQELQSSLLPAFSNFIEVDGFAGPLVDSITTSDEDQRLLFYSDYWTEFTGDPPVSQRYEDRVDVYGGSLTTTTNRNTVSGTRIPFLENLLASDFRSLASYEDIYTYDSDTNLESVTTVGSLVSSTVQPQFICDRTMDYTVFSRDVTSGGAFRRQGIIYDRPDNYFEELPGAYEYAYSFETGTFDENTGILTLDAVSESRPVYYMSESTVYNSYSKTEYDVDFQSAAPDITLGTLIGQFEALPFWTKTVYTRTPVDNTETPTGPSFTITAGQFQFSGETVSVQDGNLNFGTIKGIDSTPEPAASDQTTYRYRSEQSPINKQGYLCRSKGNGLFDIYTCACIAVDGNTLSAYPTTINQAAIAPVPAEMSYTQMTIVDVVLIQSDLPFWPHAVEGKDTFAVRNWEAMNCKKEDSVIYSDIERATITVNQGGGGFG